MMIVKVVSITPHNLVQHRVNIGATSGFKTIVDFGGKKFFAIKVGDEGRRRVQRFIPLLNIPCPPDVSPWGEAIRKLIVLQITTLRLRRGQHGWLGEVVEPEAVQPVGSLVLLDTWGGFRGYTQPPHVFGQAEVIETGWYAQGHTGRAGRHPDLMILATGPARIEWVRAGRLYDSPREWVAYTADGLAWQCMPRHDYGVACDAGIIPDAVMRLGREECLDNT